MSGENDPKDPKAPRADSEAPRSMTSSELSREARDAFRGAAKTAETLQRKLSRGDFKLDLGADAHARTVLQKAVEHAGPKRRSVEPALRIDIQAIAKSGHERLKGMLPHAIHHWILRSFGDEGIRAVAKALPPELSSRFESDAFNALEWCSLDDAHVILETAVATLSRGDASLFADLAEENFSFEFAGLFQSTNKTIDLIVKRSPISWGRILDFGRVRVSEENKTLLLRFEDFERVGSPLRHVIVGTMRALASTAEPPKTARVYSGFEAFAPTLVLAFD